MQEVVVAKKGDSEPLVAFSSEEEKCTSRVEDHLDRKEWSHDKPVTNHQGGTNSHKTQGPWQWREGGAYEESQRAQYSCCDGVFGSSCHHCCEGGPYDGGHDSHVIDLLEDMRVGVDVSEG